MGTLCQEYQVNWLSNQIEKYLSNAKISDTDLILEYIQLSKRMGFTNGDVVVTNLINQFSDHFLKIQNAVLFFAIGRDIQMKIARKRLNDMMVIISTPETEYSTARISIPEHVRNTLLFDCNNGLSFFFRDIFLKT